MFNFLKYILLFILGYKVLKEVFKDPNQKREMSSAPEDKTIHYTNNGQNTTADQNKFEDAEAIEFEELK